MWFLFTFLIWCHAVIDPAGCVCLVRALHVRRTALVMLVSSRLREIMELFTPDEGGD